LVGVAVLIWTAALPALAPGAVGELVVQPRDGNGLLVVGPHGQAPRVICGDTSLCGHPTDPRWSPDGRDIAFTDAATSRVAIVAADGNCMWCLLGTPLTTIRGAGPAFAADDGRLTLATRRGLWEVSMGGSPARRLVTGPVADAAWSAGSRVALVRAGWVWVSGPGASVGHPGLRRLARGTSPAWSPDGSEIALARGGRVWIVRVRGGRARRLVRGGDPAWSPDGHSLAFIGPGRFVETVGSNGGPEHRVGDVLGRAVDWQPLPRPAEAPTCAKPLDAHVLAANAQAVIWTRTSGEGADETDWACLRTLGVRRVLYAGTSSDGCYGGTSLVREQLAGRFAALAFSDCDHYGGCNKEFDLVDISTGRSTKLASENCSFGFARRPALEYGFPRLPGIDSLVVDLSGFTAWHATDPVSDTVALQAVACASASLCAAVDAAGRAFTSTSPTGPSGAWSIADANGTQALFAVSCPSTILCVAGGADGNIATATDPAGAPAWSIAHVDADANGLLAISCPSVTLCAGGDAGGNLVTSTDPAGGASTWALTPVETALPPLTRGISGVSCPSVSLCVAVDDGGNAVTSTDPTGGSPAWNVTPIDSVSGLHGVSCPSATMCAAVDQLGEVLTSSDPNGGASAWTATKVERGGLNAIACPSTSLCVAVDQTGNIVTSTDPTGGAASWHMVAVDPGNELSGVTCPSASLCVAVDTAGIILTSTDPAGRAGAWTNTSVDALPCAATSPCIAEQLYVRDDHGTRVADSAPPGPGDLLGDLALGGNSLTLTWNHSAAPAQLGLG
jgi:hypothetical protein